MSSMEYLMIGGLLAAVLAVASIGAATGGFEGEAERSALLAAFPVTERFISAIGLMQSQREESFVQIELPKLSCSVIINGRYVETVVHRGGKTARYGLFLFAETDQHFQKIDCDPATKVKVCVRRSTQTNIISVVQSACT